MFPYMVLVCVLTLQFTATFSSLSKECDTYESCKDVTWTQQQSDNVTYDKIYCRGFQSCLNNTNIDIEKYLFCYASQACTNFTTAETNKNTTMDALLQSINCDGQQACFITIHTKLVRISSLHETSAFVF